MTTSAWLGQFIPSSSDLTDEEFRSRHRIVIVGYVLAAIVSAVVGVWVAVHNNDFEWSHALTELTLSAVPGLALFVLRSRIAAQLLACTGILAACGLMVHGANGYIEAHFSFFVTLPLIALYTDWRPFAYSVAYVAVSHGVLGTVTPETMYNHEAAISSPYLWGLIHAAFVLALCAVMLVHWNFSDRKRLELRVVLDDLRQTQDQLVEAQKLESIGSLAAGVAHEINTPIQFVGDNLEFISETAADFDRFVTAWLQYQSAVTAGLDASDQLQSLQQVVAEIDLEFALEEMPGAVAQSLDGVHRVAEIVRAMKGFSHPRNEISPTDLNSLISDTTVVSRSEWKYVAELELNLDQDLPATAVPPGSFNQAVLNLIVNASHAIQDRFGRGGELGLITISSAVVDDDTVAITVADNGCGIPEDVRAKVFDRFFTTKEVGRGTGQGLAITQSLVASLHGRIELHSEVGVGTRFTVVLPIKHSGPAGEERSELGDKSLVTAG